MSEEAAKTVLKALTSSFTVRDATQPRGRRPRR